MKPFTLYRVVRIDGLYDPSVTDEQNAKDAALESFPAEANSNALYNGEQDGVRINEIADCGESV